jgi:hypothetical protein
MIKAFTKPRWRLTIRVLVVLFSCSLAQSFSGTFSLPTATGGIILTLKQDDVGNATGTLAGNGATFTLTGELGDQETGIAYGIIETSTEPLLFEAYLEEPQLTLYILGVDAGDNPITTRLKN